jgi:hypothetical protein
MSQNDEYFNRRGVTKRSCGCTLKFHFDNVSISSTVLTVVQHSVYREMNVATSNIGVMVWGPFGYISHLSFR